MLIQIMPSPTETEGQFQISLIPIRLALSFPTIVSAEIEKNKFLEESKINKNLKLSLQSFYTELFIIIKKLLGMQRDKKHWHKENDVRNWLTWNMDMMQ